MTADDEEQFYFWEMAVAKAPGMFRPFKGKSVKLVQEKKEENRETSSSRSWGEFTVGIITGAVVSLVVRRMLCGRSPRLRG